MGSSRRMKLGGDPEKTLNKGPAQGQTQGQNHGGAGNGPESYSNRGMNGNGASNGGGDIEMGDDRKSGGSTRNSMRSRHSADEVSLRCCCRACAWLVELQTGTADADRLRHACPPTAPCPAAAMRGGSDVLHARQFTQSCGRV